MLFVRGDNTTTRLSLSSAPIRNPVGEIIGAVVTFVDISDRKRAQDAQQEFERNYREIFDLANDAIFLHDAQTGEILDVNQKMMEMYGYSLDEARLLTVEDVSAGVAPYTQNEAKAYLRKPLPA